MHDLVGGYMRDLEEDGTVMRISDFGSAWRKRWRRKRRYFFGRGPQHGGEAGNGCGGNACL